MKTSEPANENPPIRTVRTHLEADGAPPVFIKIFENLLDRFLQGETGLLPEKDLHPLGVCPEYGETAAFAAEGRDNLAKTVIVKLNGGLGTSMGLERVKSLIPLKDGRTFLDIILTQRHALEKIGHCSVPLWLMDSFYTADDTAAFLQRHTGVFSFVQHRAPRLCADSLQPLAWPARPEWEWYPPGHADLYTALVSRGLLARWLDEGREFMFVSNADNLGATLDPAILGYMAARETPFLMEVAQRLASDRKGGHLARNAAGRLLLRESAQCPPDDAPAFQDIRRYRVFNTNNLWVHLPSLHRAWSAWNGIPPLPLIVNRKTADPRDSNSPPVIQLECAAGAAISLFEDSAVLLVPRARFAPVKTTNDLLVLRSDATDFHPDGAVAPHNGVIPTIDLDPRFYRNLSDFDARFPEGPPSLRAARKVTVRGDFRFGRAVILHGEIDLINPDDSQRRIEDGAVISG